MNARRPYLYLFALLAVFLIGPITGLRSQSVDPSPRPGLPPVAPVRPVTDDYFGIKVVDPYRYMENLKDPQVQAWMKAQNDYTRAALDSIPGREKLLVRIQQLSKSRAAEVSNVRRVPGDVYFYEKRLAGEVVASLYMGRGLDGEEKLVVDPQKVRLAPSSRGKGKNMIAYFAPSPDAKYVAVGIEPGGSENDMEIHVFETASGRETGDVIHHALWARLFEPAWLPGGRSFVYSLVPPPGAPATELERSYLHILGTDPAKDPPIFGYGIVPSIPADRRHWAWVMAPPGSRYVLGIVSGVSPNSAYYIEPAAEVGKADSAWRRVADFSDDVSDVAIHGNDLYVLTYKNAPRYKVLRVDARRPDLASGETVVPPSDAVVTGADPFHFAINPAQDALYVQLLDGGIGRLLRVPYGPRPHVREIDLPIQGAIQAVSSDPRLPGALLTMNSWTQAYKIYAYDPTVGQVIVTKLQPAGPNDDPQDIESAEVKARSYDGTQVPLSIVYAKKIRLDGSNPTLLVGYGAYGASMSPRFSPGLLAWYEQGGIFAVCHVRGGGEYGEEWHLAGKGPTKPNTWRDFIACAQYLIDNKYTSPARLAGMGGSAGGILIGRAITSRPDLFAASIDSVGLSDTLRFEQSQSRQVNTVEFGSVKTKAGFEALYAMSPYAHVMNGTKYPAVLLETGANDPRVPPWQMDKMAARLQAATSSGKPVLLSVDYHGGHGITRTEQQYEKRDANEFSFLLWQFGVPGFQPPKP